MTRQLDEILSSGEISEFNKGGVTADDAVLDQGETKTLIDDKLADGSVATIYKGGVTAGDAVLTQDEVDARVLVKLADGTVTDAYKGGTDPGDALQTEDEVNALISAGFTSFWKGNYDPSVTYAEGSLVKDCAWVMVATAETDDSPAPTPTGPIVFDYSDEVNLTATSASAPYIYFGIRYTAPEDSLLTGVRIYMLPDYIYSIYLVQNAGVDAMLKPVTTYHTSQTGWILCSPAPVPVREGDVLDLLVKVEPGTPVETSDVANWNYSHVSIVSVPSAGQMLHLQDPANQIYLHFIDSDAVDQTGVGGVLENIAVGSQIRYGGLTWTIEAIVDNTTYYTLTVSPSVRFHTEGIHEFTFVNVTSTLLPYHYETDHRLGDTTFRGLYAAGAAYTDIVADDNQYGIDLAIQTAYISPDWELILNSVSTLNISEVGVTGQEKHLYDAIQWVYTYVGSLGPTLSTAEIDAVVAGNPPPAQVAFFIVDDTRVWQCVDSSGASDYLYMELVRAS